MKKGTKGITLIALVITIIVLLILAGITIATLTGENGILGKADTAKQRTQVEEEKEQLVLAYNAVMAENKGTGVTEGQLRTELQKYDSGVEVTTKGENFEVKFSKGNIYTIKKDGTINSGSIVTAEEVNALIGQTVDYKDNSGGKVDAWRVFYASDEEMFLISSNTMNSRTAFGSNNGIPLNQKITNKDYTGAIDVFATGYGATYNDMWKATNSTDTRNKSKAIAYLCDSNNWTEYVGNNASYAVGGPTKELFIKSWNASRPQTDVQEVTLASEDVTENGYASNKPSYLYDEAPVLKTILPKTPNGEDGLYNNGATYWLASPSSWHLRRVQCVRQRDV